MSTPPLRAIVDVMMKRARLECGHWVDTPKRKATRQVRCEACGAPETTADVPRRYGLRPVEVTAIQWTGRNLTEILTLTGRINQDLSFSKIGIFSPVNGPGYRVCERLDWVVKYPNGEVKPMARAEFEATYEALP